MTVSGVSSNATSSTANLGNSSNTIAGNFDQFLTLLTTQLKNQNPLDPLDTNQFTQQLVQFSAVEQQLKTNSYLDAMMLASQNQTNTQAVTLIGKTVTTSGTTTDLVDGKATWTFNLPQAAKVSISIRDTSGNVVKTDTATMGAGNGQYVWDGKNDDGHTSPAGSYTISIDARTSSGGYVAASTQATGVVTGVDLKGNEPVLMVGNSRYKLSTVSSVLAGS